MNKMRQFEAGNMDGFEGGELGDIGFIQVTSKEETRAGHSIENPCEKYLDCLRVNPPLARACSKSPEYYLQCPTRRRTE